MKIVLLHGDDIEKSYKRLSQIQKGVVKKGWRVHFLEPDEELSLHLVNNTMFDSDILYVVKDAEKLPLKQLEWIGKNSKDFSSQLLLLSNKAFSKKQKSLLPKDVKIEQFDRPVFLWKMLDSLVPGNSKEAFSYLAHCLEKNPPELVSSIIGGRFCELYFTKLNVDLGYPHWRQKKLNYQAKKFTNEELESIMDQIADIDYKSKTSDADLELMLEIFINKNL